MKRVVYGSLSVSLLLFLILYFGGTYIGVALFSRPIYVLPPSTERLARDAFYIMDKHGIFAKENNFKKDIPELMDEVKGAENFEQIIPIINQASKLAGGEHSSYITIDESFGNKYFNENLQTFPKVSNEDGIVTLSLPPFKSSQDSHAEKYVSMALAAFENSNIKGIILDLQGNTGGSMGPMLAAVSSLITDGKVFSYVTNEGEYPYNLQDKVWSYRGKKIFETPSDRKLQDVPVGVLINEQTASAAEATLIALKSNPNVKIFGKPTAGLATGVAIWPLYKGHALAIAGTKTRDIHGNLYGEDPIPPDLVTDEPAKEALAWIKTNFK